MSDERFYGNRILTTGRGQCERCAQIIVRVLVAHAGGRRWESADIGMHGYVTHTCPQPPPSNLRKAA